MKGVQKRVLSLLLALCMALGALPGTAWAAELRDMVGDVTESVELDVSAFDYGEEPLLEDMLNLDNGVQLYADRTDHILENGATLTFDSSTGTITDCKPGSAMEIVIPAKIGGAAVISIGLGAFYSCRNLTSVTIPDSVTSIGRVAFYYCSNLTSIIIPDSVTSIGDHAFWDCNSLTSVTIPDGITSIENGAFYSCSSLGSVTIPDSVTSIGDYAFQYCSSLTSVSIPDSVTFIGDQAFYGCSSLTDVYYTSSKSQWESIEIGFRNDPLSNAVFHENSAGPNTPKPPDESDSWSYDEATQTLTISGNGAMEDYSEDSQSPWHKYADQATSLVVKEGVTSIGNYAFDFFNKLSNVNLPQSLTHIGVSAFELCDSLTNIEIPEGVTSIGENAFGACGLRSITIPVSLNKIEPYAFSLCTYLRDVHFNGTKSEWIILRDNNSTGNMGLFSATIHYKQTEIYCDGGNRTEAFDDTLEGYLSKTSSTTYSPELAHMLMAMAWAAYDQNDAINSMRSLGFKDADIVCHYPEGYLNTDVIAYAIGKKTMIDGRNLVLITVRGSSSPRDWLSNFNIVTKNGSFGWHSGFDSAASDVWTSLKNFIGNDFSNTIFAVTGHSRGAATANLLEIKLFEEKVPQRNVYGYNFACPDVAVAIPTMWNWLGEHNNMFNINAAGDPVSVLPGMAGDIILTTDKMCSMS